MKSTTLVYLIRGNRILLGKKKRGFATGKWNGIGGKVEYGEDIEDAAEREVWEECCIKVRGMVRVAELTFLFPHKPEWNQSVHVFASQDFSGEPVETEEMLPRWFDARELPFKDMWADDPHWLPRILSGERLRGKFVFGSDNARIDSMKVEPF